MEIGLLVSGAGFVLLVIGGPTADDRTFGRTMSGHDTLNFGRLGYSKYVPKITGLGYHCFRSVTFVAI